ncbi:MAG: SRPBCC family protein [Verrucomicrobiales bacterium]|nr:SRPBCC family protein [Verrucomicrobiales bacterium]
MNTTFESRTLTVSIAREADAVYQFISNPANLPRWATAFCKSIRQAGSDWVMQTSGGEMKVRFVPPNAFRVADHFVSPAPGVEIFVPMRVLPNGSGSEVVFTLFRQPFMSPEKFAEDIGLVEQDLRTLKSVLEK